MRRMLLMRQLTRAAYGWHAPMLHPAPIHSRWTIALSNLRRRTRSVTLATPPIPAPSVLLHFRQEPRRPSRSIRSLHGTGSTEILFRLWYSKHSRLTWHTY